MFRPKDISQISARGSNLEQVEKQILNFENGFPFLKLIEPATNYHGIIKLSESEILKFKNIFEEKITEGLKPIKFVPASGAASRMFKSLFSALSDFQDGKTVGNIDGNDEALKFLNQINQFAFYNDLKAVASKEGDLIDSISSVQLLELLLLENGLNYGNLPKGLLKFHKYAEEIRTPLEEHLIEGALYSKDKENTVNIHFTVSPEHQLLFEKHVAEIIPKYEQLFQVKYFINFSQQKPSTDTIAVSLDNEPFRNGDDSLLFRPAGHGALLVNLNELEADLIFIKNIDNVVTDQHRETTIEYKKALAGVLLNIQEQVFFYQKTLKEHHPSTLESAFYAEASNFLENVLNIKPTQSQYYSEKEELYYYFSKKFNRPLRVCGMVKNQGDPGGGPFFAMNNDGSISLHIVESSQIDNRNTEQAALVKAVTHFNPVDLVCSVRNHQGEKYNLLDFTDPTTGFISVKSKDGKDLKAQELPGLWNGSMADWNTIFVEVPVETFNPVKTVTDLLRKEHQSN